MQLSASTTTVLIHARYAAMTEQNAKRLCVCSGILAGLMLVVSCGIWWSVVQYEKEVDTAFEKREQYSSATPYSQSFGYQQANICF